jgi:hypothetical protein
VCVRACVCVCAHTTRAACWSPTRYVPSHVELASGRGQSKSCVHSGIECKRQHTRGAVAEKQSMARPRTSGASRPYHQPKAGRSLHRYAVTLFVHLAGQHDACHPQHREACPQPKAGRHQRNTYAIAKPRTAGELAGQHDACTFATANHTVRAARWPTRCLYVCHSKSHCSCSSLANTVRRLAREELTVGIGAATIKDLPQLPKRLHTRHTSAQ